MINTKRLELLNDNQRVQLLKKMVENEISFIHVIDNDTIELNINKRRTNFQDIFIAKGSGLIENFIDGNVNKLKFYFNPTEYVEVDRITFCHIAKNSNLDILYYNKETDEDLDKLLTRLAVSIN